MYDICTTALKTHAPAGCDVIIEVSGKIPSSGLPREESGPLRKHISINGVWVRTAEICNTHPHLCKYAYACGSHTRRPRTRSASAPREELRLLLLHQGLQSLGVQAGEFIHEQLALQALEIA